MQNYTSQSTLVVLMKLPVYLQYRMADILVIVTVTVTYTTRRNS